MGRKTEFDWGAIAEDFITAQFPQTMSLLAKKYNGTREHFSRMSKKENWRARRVVYQKKVQEESAALTGQTPAEKIGAFNNRMFSLSNWLIGQALQDRKSGAKTSEIAWTLQRAQQIGKIALGDVAPAGDKKEVYIAEWGKNDVKELQAGTVIEPTISEEKPE